MVFRNCSWTGPRGHSTGDLVLKEFAKVAKNTLRVSDIVARIGGDEFIILMPNTAGTEAEKVIDKINKAAKKITVESLELSISFGFSTKNETHKNIHETHRTAEDQMYRVKLLEIPSMRSGAIETILKTLYEKDEKSEIHSRAVSEISEKLAIANEMNRQEVNEVKTAGLLHDIGKIIIPISILTKEGLLSSEEYNLIKGHPEIGFRILNSTQDMRNISTIVLNHHERWDGTGYPRGIKEDEIPFKARIIAIADSFDAMTNERTYREIITKEEALIEIVNCAGTQFDPKLVETFRLHFKEIMNEFGTAYVETDMRALYNPTRMQVIKKATEKLVDTILSLCPKCQEPGFTVAEVKQGLPCEWCNSPTRSTLSFIYSCKKCNHSLEKTYPHNKTKEDPMYCDFCNP